MTLVLNVAAILLGGVVLFAPESWRSSTAGKWVIGILAFLVVVLGLVGFLLKPGAM